MFSLQRRKLRGMLVFLFGSFQFFGLHGVYVDKCIMSIDSLTFYMICFFVSRKNVYIRSVFVRYAFLFGKVKASLHSWLVDG